MGTIGLKAGPLAGIVLISPFLARFVVSGSRVVYRSFT
jgi:hypothetical protein